MCFSGVNPEPFSHPGSQSGMGQHPVYGMFDCPCGIGLHHLFESNAFKSAGIPGMPVIKFLFHFVAGNTDLFSVDNHDKIAGILTGGVHRLMLAHEQAGYPCGYPAQGLVLGINQMPLSFNISRSGTVSLHAASPSKGSG